ncbi:TetR/AcrR family transcriptional regulator, partial [Streptomyces sp. NPDC052693]
MAGAGRRGSAGGEGRETCAGVAKGTVYYNFASKSVLFEELLRHGVGL